MAELRDRLELVSVNRGEAVLGGTSRNPITRQGPSTGVTIDRASWEALGRPVDLSLTLSTDESLDPPMPTERVLDDVREARRDQLRAGYTAAHDDEHGLEHIVKQARDRIQPLTLHTRDDLLEAAACLVAAAEWMDRVASPLPPQGSTTMNGVRLDPNRPEPPFPGEAQRAPMVPRDYEDPEVTP